MAIQTYDDLKAAVARWLKRTNLADAPEDFITLAEAKLNRRLKVRQMRSVLQLTPTSAYVALPGDYRSAIRVMYGNTPLRFLPESMADPSMNLGGDFNRYALIGDKIWLLTHVDGKSVLTLHYYQQLEPLSETNTSNWLLEDGPDIYLYASLLEAEPYIKNDERIVVWQSKLEEALRDIGALDDEGQHSGSDLTMEAG